MNDFICISLAVFFLAASLAYIELCAKLRGQP